MAVTTPTVGAVVAVFTSCCDLRCGGLGFEGRGLIEIGHLDDPIVGRLDGGGVGHIQRNTTFEIEQTIFESARHCT